jgi:hypothetical protein
MSVFSLFSFLTLSIHSQTICQADNGNGNGKTQGPNLLVLSTAGALQGFLEETLVALGN